MFLLKDLYVNPTSKGSYYTNGQNVQCTLFYVGYRYKICYENIMFRPRNKTTDRETYKMQTIDRSRLDIPPKKKPKKSNWCKGFIIPPPKKDIDHLHWETMDRVRNFTHKCIKARF